MIRCVTSFRNGLTAHTLELIVCKKPSAKTVRVWPVRPYQIKLRIKVIFLRMHYKQISIIQITLKKNNNITWLLINSIFVSIVFVLKT